MGRHSYRLKFLSAVSVVITLLLFAIASGCGDSSGEGKKGSDKRSIGEEKAPAINYTLEKVSTQDFTIDLPRGWKYELNPSNLQFGLVAYDPDHPERRLFYYYMFNPFLKSEEAHDFWRSYYPDSIYAACPVLSTATVSEFYTKWNDYIDWLSGQGVQAAVMKFKDIDIVETHPLEDFLADYSLDSTVVRSHLMLESSNLPCEGLLSGAVVNLGSYYEAGIDLSELMVYNVSGIIAPADEFTQLQEVLASCLGSFTFTESYARSYIQQSQEATKTILDNARAMQAACDSYNDAWHSRQPVNDAISQKESDSTLGYDRLYDEDTGEIYRAEIGWYDSYDLHRSEYSRPNIHKLEDNDYDRYSKSVDHYIYK